ncbi:Bug family tripartite tricarboxylate transporter substrate binding protein [Variovorax paradoxus]|uniref:Bug family tripartite tricarboxylate transporter substrate binding protein n=1 Tax=Variovorax paradoxus TaxID=34073 RepID=UPI0029C7FB8F|nr:tripartite tricarboxylate transporter substrate binding protein [Variovorax paradoxus]
MNRFNFMLTCLAAVSSLTGAPTFAQQPAYPDRPIRLVVGFSAGGGADNVARALADAMGRALGQSVIVDNKPGAGTTLAAGVVARSPADGYTLMLLTSTNTISPSMYKSLSYDPATGFNMISTIAHGPMLIAASKESGIRTLADLVARAKKEPGKLNYGAGGVGTTPHLAALVLQRDAGIQMTHIPYKGGSETAVALVGSQIDVQFGTPPAVAPIASRANILAVTTARRTELAPGVPAGAETVKGYEVASWYGIGGPAGMPKDVIRKLSKAVHTAMADDRLRKQFALLGVEASAGTPEEADKLYASELARWSVIVRSENLKADN